MAWFRIPWRPWTHEKLPQSVDEEHIGDPRPKYIQTSHEFSWAITVLNLLLTILTITVVSLPEKPQRYLGLDALVEQPCNCQTPVVDRRYKNPKLNPDIKRVSGYCEQHQASKKWNSCIVTDPLSYSSHSRRS
jgi:hypothetical protein